MHDAAARGVHQERALAQQADPHFRPGDVRLNFLTQRWSHVLRKVAEQSGSTLVMEEAPRTRYTRRDLKTYSRSDAVRILNRELALQGYQLREEGQFLVLRNLRKLRTEYTQRELPARPEVSVAPPTTPKGQM
ncbi:MAG: hypothetical protein KY442_08475, partial [Proteobacteria bacterium]|nr:hypothetical protein [Pseudomonadota bacterium]